MQSYGWKCEGEEIMKSKMVFYSFWLLDAELWQRCNKQYDYSMGKKKDGTVVYIVSMSGQLNTT